MILDNGVNVFLWPGKKTSDVEIKLSFKSAQVSLKILFNYSVLSICHYFISSLLNSHFSGQKGSGILNV